MKTLSLALSWFFGLFFGGLAIFLIVITRHNGLLYTIPLALSLSILSISSLPPTRKAIGARNKKELSSKAKTACITVLVIATALSSALFISGATNDSAAHIHKLRLEEENNDLTKDQPTVRENDGTQ